MASAAENNVKFFMVDCLVGIINTTSHALIDHSYQPHVLKTQVAVVVCILNLTIGEDDQIIKKYCNLV